MIHRRLLSSMLASPARTYRHKMLDTQRSDLVAYWPFNGNAFDLSGHGYNGTASNVSWGPGMLTDEKCAVFTGTGYINVFSAELIAAMNVNEFTITAWWKVSDVADWTDGAYRNVMYLYKDGSNYAQMAKRSTATQFNWGYTSKSNNLTTASPTTWQFSAIAVSITQSLCDVWFNTSKTVKGLPATWVGTPTLFTIGASSLVPAQPWKGSIEHVGLWKTKLSDGQLTALNTTTPPFLGVRRPWMVGYSEVGGDDEVIE